MREIRPDYYNEFHCIADQCRHTCCRGWEIDIDEETLAYYRKTAGAVGELLRRYIDVTDDGTAHFQLQENETCPFLNQKNLCDLIPLLGENHLCQICRDHPRFRNFFSDRTETGLGLCCEEAARLILTRQKEMDLRMNGEESLTKEEQIMIDRRDYLLCLAQDRSLPIEKRFENILDAVRAKLPDMENYQWADFLKGLERMDTAWETRIENLRNSMAEFTASVPSVYQTAMEQMCVYFLYRHVAGAVYDGDISARAAFSVLSCRLIWAMWNALDNGKFEDLIDIARQYSAEVEYSENNLCTMLDYIDDEILN